MRHTCAGRNHDAPLTPEHTTRLGCGCTRHRGTRCDGTPVEWLDPAICGRHREEEQ